MHLLYPGTRSGTMRHTLILITISLVLSNSATTAVSAQAQPTRMDLATLYDLGNLVVDTNADSVPDLVNASLILLSLIHI